VKVPLAIAEPYAAGERAIRVAPSVYADYCDELMDMYRRGANEVKDAQRWVAYKDARVILDEGLA
jgi:hypothetical protein